MEKINWEHFNSIFNLRYNSLCRGEENKLLTGEIRIINEVLERMKNDAEFVTSKFNEARSRFRNNT